MIAYTGWNLSRALADAHTRHVTHIAYRDASELARTVVHPANWKVCSQTLSAGTYRTSRELSFKVVESGDSCAHPPRRDAALPNSNGSSSSSGGTSSGSGSTSSGSGSTSSTALCSIRSSAGNCYHAGEFCSSADVGLSTTDAAGRTITCSEESGRNHWHY